MDCIDFLETESYTAQAGIQSGAEDDLQLLNSCLDLPNVGNLRRVPPHQF